jgi:hypothetical protein
VHSDGGLAERQPQTGLEQDHAHGDRDERLVKTPEEPVGLHVLGRDPGDEPDGKEHHDRRNRQPAREQLGPDCEDGDEPEAEEDVVR